MNKYSFGLLVLLLASCTKDEDTKAYLEPNDAYNVWRDGDMFLFNHFYYKPGTYWIYENDLNQRDSVFVISSSIHEGISTMPPVSPGMHENLNYRYIKIELGGIDEIKTIYLKGNAFNLYKSEGKNSGNLFTYCRGRICEGGNTSLIGEHIINNTIVYQNVYKAIFTNQLDNQNPPVPPIADSSIFYINSEAGILQAEFRKDYEPTEVKKLIRYVIAR